MPTTDQYAVFGHPIGHSKSPAIHRAFADATQQRLTYRAIEAPLEGFTDALHAFRREGGCGCNVTVPFKGDACSAADWLDPDAALAGAVNTLRWDESGRLLGFNTDGKGLLRDLQQNLSVELAGRRVLMVGAGGAAAGVIGPLLQAQPEELVVVNRTHQRAESLVEKFSAIADGRLKTAPLQTPGLGYDLVVNATSAGLTGEMPTLPDGLFGADGWAYDLVYADAPTAFLRWAAAAGASHRHDGLGMLVEQAAEAFFIWRGIRPETALIISGLRP